MGRRDGFPVRGGVLLFAPELSRGAFQKPLRKAVSAVTALHHVSEASQAEIGCLKIR
jgi:hypothetical protein